MEKLFEEDPYLTQFSARVESCVQSKKGFDVTLDQTAFYPEGGGQPYDTGVWAASGFWRSTSGRAAWSTLVMPL